MNQTETRAVIKNLQKKRMPPKEIHEDMVQILAVDFLFNCQEVGGRIQTRQKMTLGPVVPKPQ